MDFCIHVVLYKEICYTLISFDPHNNLFKVGTITANQVAYWEGNAGHLMSTYSSFYHWIVALGNQTHTPSSLLSSLKSSRNSLQSLLWVLCT